MKKILIITFLVLIACTLADAQCAMCRMTVESTVSNGRSTIASNLNTGILYLLSAPYFLVVAVGFFWYKYSKEATAKKANIRKRVQAAMNS